MPLFSIIIPTFNRAHILMRAINSVLSQGFVDWELIIVDDGSTDGTEKLVASYCDSRLLYLQQTNRGVGEARNHGAYKANGIYLIFLDSDDEFSIGYLNFVYKKTQADPDVIFVGVEFFLDSKLVRGILPTKPYGRPSLDGLFLAGSFVVKRTLFLRVGGYDTLISYGENTELSIRLSKLIESKSFIDQYLLRVYQVKHNRTSNSHLNIINSLTYVLEKHKKYYEGHPHTHWLYLNSLGVSLMRVRRKREARKCFMNAIKLDPLNWKSFGRLIASFLPIYKS